MVKYSVIFSNGECIRRVEADMLAEMFCNELSLCLLQMPETREVIFEANEMGVIKLIKEK